MLEKCKWKKKLERRKLFHAVEDILPVRFSDGPRHFAMNNRSVWTHQDDQTLHTMLKAGFKLSQRFSKTSKAEPGKTRKTLSNGLINLLCRAAVLSNLPSDWEAFCHLIICPSVRLRCQTVAPYTGVRALLPELSPGDDAKMGKQVPTHSGWGCSSRYISLSWNQPSRLTNTFVPCHIPPWTNLLQTQKAS